MEVGACSVAFPAISTSVYGNPINSAAEIAVSTLLSTPTTVALVRVIAFDEPTAHGYREVLDRVT